MFILLKKFKMFYLHIRLPGKLAVGGFVCVCVVSKQEVHEIIHCKVVGPSFLLVSFGVGLTLFLSLPYSLCSPSPDCSACLAFFEGFFF